MVNSKLATFDIRQSFRPGFSLSLYRAFPKFPGYWKFLEILTWVLPRSVSVVQAEISLDRRIFRVPLDLRNPYQIDIYAKNKKELCEPALFARLLKRGDFYLDVGANCGWHCRLLSEVVGETGLIVALEPGRRSFAYLTKLTSSNILPLCYAATAVNGTILAENSSLMRQWEHYSALPGSRAAYGAGEGLVVGRSIDHLLREFRRLPDIIKIDVEGGELEVLRGASQTLKSVSTVLVEVNPEERCRKWGYRIADIYVFMADHGYGYRYEVRTVDDSVYQLGQDEQIAGDILFSRSPIAI